MSPIGLVTILLALTTGEILAGVKILVATRNTRSQGNTSLMRTYMFCSTGSLFAILSLTF